MQTLSQSIIAQAPMDGVSDAAFRYITDTVGHPDMLFTEFVPVEGIVHGRPEVLRAFIRHQTNTTTIAQIYGTEIPAFYTAAIIALELGYDGVDINMGCPDKSVSGRGAGAGLIRTPTVAASIINTVRLAVRDWHEGCTIESLTIRTRMKDAALALRSRLQSHPDRKQRKTVSVKTRLGCDCSTIADWIPHLAQTGIDWISLHGRTLTQMYTGFANWDEIAKAKELIKDSGVKLFGNGDIKSRSEALNKIADYRLDGVLIGRASWGNPWVFCDTEPDVKLRLQTAIAHGDAYACLMPDGYFPSMRKHLAWYCRGFEQSAQIRHQLMQVTTADKVREILTPFIS